MTEYEILEQVRANGNGKYAINYADGSSETVRLFVSSNGYLCRFLPRSSRRGYVFHGNGQEIVSACKVVSKKKPVDVVRDNLRKIVKYTSESGLWPEVRAAAEHYLALDDDTFMSVSGRHYDGLREYERAHGLVHFTDGGLMALSDTRIIT